MAKLKKNNPTEWSSEIGRIVARGENLLGTLPKDWDTMRHKAVAFLILVILMLPDLAAGAQDCSGALTTKMGVAIPPKIEKQLQNIAKSFCVAQTQGGRAPTTILVTSGTRSTAEEAGELQKRLEKGDRLTYYENQEAIKEVLDAFTRHLPIKDLLDHQIARGCYVSKHLFDRAADIQNSTMDTAARTAFKSIATNEGALLIENEGGVHDHFHLNFPPYPGDPKRCPK